MSFSRERHPPLSWLCRSTQLVFYHTFHFHFMCYFYIIALLASLMPGACDQPTSTSSDPSNTAAAPTTPSLPTPAPTNAVDPAPVVEDVHPTPLDLGHYDEEKRKINAEVDRINRELASFTLKEFKKEHNGHTYDLLQYKDANGTLVRVKAIDDQESWEIYNMGKAQGEAQRIYASYLAKTDNPYKPIRKQFYHIGSIQERDKPFTLVLDEANAPMEGAPRQEWLDRYQSLAVLLTAK